MPDTPGICQRRQRMLLYGFGATALLAWLAAGLSPAPAILVLAGAATYAAVLFSAQARVAVPTGIAAALLTAAALLLQPTADVPSMTSPYWWLAVIQFSAIVLVYLDHFRALPLATARLLLVAVLVALTGWWATWLTGAPLVAFAAALLAIGAGIGLLERCRMRWIERPSGRQVKLSVMLICKNEADRIEVCLQGVTGWADEIVVIDSGSIDGTRDIARRYTDQVWQLDWPGYGRQKQRALERCSGDWVLSIDADELVTDELRREIDAYLSAPGKLVAMRFAWVSKVFGRFVFFGADGRYHTRLFRRLGARFDEADVHEDVLVRGRVATLGGPVCHFTFRDYRHLKEKMTAYALISADRIARRRALVAPPAAFVRGLVSFLTLYFRRLGLLDGQRGLLMAMAYAGYTFDKYAAAWSRRARD